jgi:hypothetical protein
LPTAVLGGAVALKGSQDEGRADFSKNLSASFFKKYRLNDQISACSISLDSPFKTFQKV